jgi:3D (Asp-Asp-Asp) domain-containing protein
MRFAGLRASIHGEPPPNRPDEPSDPTRKRPLVGREGTVYVVGGCLGTWPEMVALRPAPPSSAAWRSEDDTVRAARSRRAILGRVRGRLMVREVSALAVGTAVAAFALTGCGSHAGRRSNASPASVRGAQRSAAAATHASAGSHRRESRAKYVNALATLSAAGSRCQRTRTPGPVRPIRHRQWLSGVTSTEYYPAPGRWFGGRRIRAPGLTGVYAADWLYSARGLAMEGDGVDQHGRQVHIAELGSTGWVNLAGRRTFPVCLGKWSSGFPVWLIGGWRNRRGEVTFPFASGGWANGRGVRRLSYGGVTFASGSSVRLRYYHSIAVDPRLIPLGSRVYVPAYHHITGGWFVAQDTGGAITSRHIDIYRPPPADAADLGRYMTRQRILVIPPR